ncbi:MAG: 3-hydroxyacyl-CoA dehydrogenase NAD-binding domain-containing protein [Candidatus Eisenbacteria bacterium]
MDSTRRKDDFVCPAEKPVWGGMTQTADEVDGTRKEPDVTKEKPIGSAAVLGAGVMGAAIAAHLANAGIPCLLLDMKSTEPDELDAKQGIGPGDPRLANRFAIRGLERALKAKPASFFSPRLRSLVRPGNFDDDAGALANVDWIVEAVVENLDIKRSLYERIAPHVADHAILSSNTSGLSVQSLSDCLPEALRSRFLVTHFFNPPRYLHLLELVPGPLTDPAVYARMAAFGEDVLGKGVVHAKDTPNFIANRIGTFGLLHAVKLMVEKQYTIAEVDRLTGKAIGRPKSATFRTADLVGLDTLLHVSKNMYDSLPDDPARDLFVPPAFVQGMLEKKWLGEKAGAGFYKKAKGADGKSEILMLDPASMEHVPQGKVAIPSLEIGKNLENLGDRLVSFMKAKDRGGAFLWENLSQTLLYAAGRLPEISDDIVNVDRALRWGFGWEMGPFEIWDAIGVEASSRRMEKEGAELPPLVQAVLANGGRFYGREGGTPLYFDWGSANAGGSMKPVPFGAKVLRLDDLKAAGTASSSADRASRGVVWESADASLVDLGDDVACLEFHTKMNTIGPGLIEAIEKSVGIVEESWRGLVIANEADNFSVGANLLLILNEIDDENYDDVDWMVRRFQNVNQRIRYSSRPVVVAPHGLTLGGGCEVTLAANRVVADAETYIGLVELGAGVIPAGGGCKEWVRRVHLSVPDGVDVDLFPFLRRAFETVGMAKVATSGVEAKDLGYLANDDVVVLNRDHRIYEAKQNVLALDIAGFDAGRPLEDIRVVGEPGLAKIRAGLHNMRASGYITEYDHVLGDKLAWVLCGGEVSAGTRVSEQYLLDLEREAFLALCEDNRTLARMEHILKTGKPLRN